MTTSTTTLDLTRFGRAADIIERDGFWDGTDPTLRMTMKNAKCIGIALLDAVSEVRDRQYDRDDAYYAEFNHLARQLGWTGPQVDSLFFVYRKNDEFKGRPDEGKAWAVSTLRKLARGESL